MTAARFSTIGDYHARQPCGSRTGWWATGDEEDENGDVAATDLLGVRQAAMATYILRSKDDPWLIVCPWTGSGYREGIMSF